MHPVKERVARFSGENGLFDKGDRILVAVSGGVDSVALLHLLTEPAWDLKLRAVYVHHGLRSEAESEAEWVCRYAESLGVQAVVERIAVREIAEQCGESVQMAARNERYRVLNHQALVWGARRIALGHHADDQAETVLLRLLTGVSPEGLSGMAPIRGDLIRPMLTIHRDEILDYAREHALTWMEDRSNRDTHYLRNRIRLELLPNLVHIQPRIVEHLLQLASMAAEWRDWQEEELTVREDGLEWFENGETISWSAPMWQALPKPLRRAVLKQAFYRLNPNQRLGYSHQNRIIQRFERKGSQGRIQLPGSGFISVSDQRMVMQSGLLHTPFKVIPECVPVAIPGRTPWPGGVLEARWITRSQLPLDWQGVSMDEAYFAIPKGSPDLVLRSRRMGDRMRVFGRTHLEKVKKLMIDSKIARTRREQTPLLVDMEDRIWWVVGVRHGEKARIQATDDRILYFKYHRIPEVLGE